MPKSTKSSLAKEEQYLYSAVVAAREIQEFLWGEFNDAWNLEEWRRMFRKRLSKIEDIDIANPHAKIEFKKRILQNAALCIALLNVIDRGGIQRRSKAPSNLKQYAKKRP